MTDFPTHGWTPETVRGYDWRTVGPYQPYPRPLRGHDCEVMHHVTIPDGKGLRCTCGKVTDYG